MGQSKNFVKESEFRRYIKNLNQKVFLIEISTAASCVLCGDNMESLLSEDDLISIEYITQFEN